ncbi:MAG: hypothetical protein ACPG7F_03445 [Aggregatilineales bacterium]
MVSILFYCDGKLHVQSWAASYATGLHVDGMDKGLVVALLTRFRVSP